jgi:hypothetical protein
MTNQVTNLKKRLLQGTKLKCVDGRWAADGLSVPERLLVVGFTRGLQCWKDKQLLDELDERDGVSMDPGPLNDEIPVEDWATGLNGEPEPPWRIVYVVYLVDPESCEFFAFINATWGARIAYERLVSKLEMMQRLRGRGVTALVKADCRQMKTKSVGMKLRPEFTILDWRDLGENEPPQPAQLSPPANAAAPVEETPPRNEPSTAAATTQKKKPATVGKPVKPVTREEEFNDKLSDFI